MGSVTAAKIDAAGAFERIFVSNTNTSGSSNPYGVYNNFNFSAAKSNAAYNGSTVQMNALQILMIIKVWSDFGWLVVARPYIPSDQAAVNVVSRKALPLGPDCTFPFIFSEVVLNAKVAFPLSG